MGVVRDKLDYLPGTKRLLREAINAVLADRAAPLLTESTPFEGYPSALYALSPAPSAGSLTGPISDKLLRLNETKNRLREAINAELGAPLAVGDSFRAYADAVFEWYMSNVIFGANEQGAWYDPSDLTTLYQDAEGTTPVTADGDPVGLMLDKSGNGNHASQSNSLSRPIYRTDGTLHWLEFDGVDDNLDTGFKLTTEHTVAVAFVCDMDDRSIITEGASRSATSGHDFDLFSTGTESRYRVVNTLYAITLQVIGPNFDAGASYVAVGAWDGSTNSDAAIFRVNQSQSSDTPTSSTKASRNNVSLGSSGSLPLDGKIYGTVLLGNKRASGNEIVSLEAYLAKLAGVTL